ncbi:hypothetical protein ACFLUJ_06550 [Chloroflexota bacterium]
MSESSQQRLAKGMRWTARVIGLLSSMFLVTIVIAEAVAGSSESIKQSDMVAGILIGALGFTGLAGCIISWWRERLASMLLLVTALGFGIHIGLQAGRNHFVAWLIIGFPYLVAAVLLLWSYRISKKLSSSKS